MKATRQHVLVLVTAPDRKTARHLARAALEANLVACANLVPRIESHYWWHGKLETSAEVLILLKTTRRQLAGLEKLVLAGHPYETPEVIVLPLVAGTPAYLDWILRSVSPK
jgi:periplasmic divalent cation tolerance protein